MDIVNFNAYAYTGSRQDLEAIRKKLAKRANQRLFRLEQATEKEGKSYLYGAYEHYAVKKLGARPRWRETLRYDGSITSLRKEVQEIVTFLNAETSTKSGVLKLEAERDRIFQSGEWGNGRGVKIEVTDSEFYRFLSSGILKGKLADYFTSAQIISAYEKARESGKEVDDILSAFTEFSASQHAKSLAGLYESVGVTEWFV